MTWRNSYARQSQTLVDAGHQTGTLGRAHPIYIFLNHITTLGLSAMQISAHSLTPVLSRAIHFVFLGVNVSKSCILTTALFPALWQGRKLPQSILGNTVSEQPQLLQASASGHGLLLLLFPESSDCHRGCCIRVAETSDLTSESLCNCPPPRPRTIK